jgi:hypothetical protein
LKLGLQNKGENNNFFCVKDAIGSFLLHGLQVLFFLRNYLLTGRAPNESVLITIQKPLCAAITELN